MDHSIDLAVQGMYIFKVIRPVMVLSLYIFEACKHVLFEVSIWIICQKIRKINSPACLAFDKITCIILLQGLCIF